VLRATFATEPPTDVTVDPLEAAGRLVQEDLCVLLPIDGSYRLENQFRYAISARP